MTSTRKKGRNPEPITPHDHEAEQALLGGILVEPEKFADVASCITYSAFFSPAEPGPVIWGIGPALVMPTNTDPTFGGDTWSTGPTAVVLAMPGSWVVGFLGQHVWSFAEHGSEPDVNSTLLQPIINYNLGDGWYLSSVPVITANWELENDEEWMVPVGGGIGRLIRLGGKLPVDLKAAAYYNAEKPKYASEWNLQLTVKVLLPKALFSGDSK